MSWLWSKFSFLRFIPFLAIASRPQAPGAWKVSSNLVCARNKGREGKGGGVWMRNSETWNSGRNSLKPAALINVPFYCRKSDDSTPKVLSDMQLNFVTEEQDPVKHLRAIVAQGRISGMAVYPDYFKILTGISCYLGLKTNHYRKIRKLWCVGIIEKHTSFESLME